MQSFYIQCKQLHRFEKGQHSVWYAVAQPKFCTASVFTLSVKMDVELVLLEASVFVQSLIQNGQLQL